MGTSFLMNQTTSLPYVKGKVYFDGNGDYLSLEGTTDFSFGTGDFTIEAIITPSSVADNKFLFSSATTGEFFFGFGGGTSTLGIGRASVAWDSYSAHGMSNGNKYHVAVSRTGTTLRFFVNGSKVGNDISNNTNYPFTNTAYIASQAAGAYYYGYMHGIKVTKGLCRYTTTFTPPTTFENNASTVLCMNFNEAVGATTFIDDTGKTVTTYGNTVIVA